jgi:deoxyribonuclease-2
MSKEISALNEEGKPVDWWFLYKVPQMAADGDSQEATGYEYLYYDKPTGKFITSANQLTSGKGALHLTLKSVFDMPASSTGWIFYNDEIPKDSKGKDSGSYGHTKGVLAFDIESKTALWLLHSWPKYVDPHPLHLDHMPVPNYGQTFLCISLDLATAVNIAAQMIDHQEPQVYTSRLPASLDKTNALYVLTKNVDTNAPGDSHILDCKTRGGQEFKVIAKNRKWGKDFWNDLVGPALKEDMDVETWIRGPIPPALDSDGVHKIFDVKFIDFRPLGFPYVWSETHDHAKWGLTVKNDWICVGDINRMISQEKRGGGTIAFQDKNLWKALKQTDLLVPPKGHTVEKTKEILKSTHKASHSGENSPE